MSETKLLKVLDEIEQLDELINRRLEQLKDEPSYSHSATTAAIRRASMDLTKALARLRSYKC